jgi:hypothetical protein
METAEFFKAVDAEADAAAAQIKARPGNSIDRPAAPRFDNDEAGGLLDLEEWDFGTDNEPIPPRGWLLGNLLCRQFLSSIFADGGVGKTALEIAMALSLATGRSLIGEHVFVRCKGLLVCFEDGKDELRRRLTAAMLHYGISKADIEGHLFVTAITRGDAKLVLMKDGGLRVGKLRDALERSIVRHGIDVTFLDPLVKIHSVSENDNAAMDFVAEILADLAIEHDGSICSPHHTRKGPADPGNADVGRGAGSLKDAFRLCYTLNPMSKEEAGLLGISNDDRVSLIRLDSGKTNPVRRSPTPRWFRLVGVRIGNETAMYPSGDEVQTIERWHPPNHFKNVSDEVWNTILDEISGGTEDGGKYSDSGKAGQARQAWRVVAKHCNKIETEAKLIIKTWKKNGVIIPEKYHDSNQGKDVLGFVVDDTKRPGAKGL